jgi:hypothetical protein
VPLDNCIVENDISQLTLSSVAVRCESHVPNVSYSSTKSTEDHAYGTEYIKLSSSSDPICIDTNGVFVLVDESDHDITEDIDDDLIVKELKNVIIKEHLCHLQQAPQCPSLHGVITKDHICQIPTAPLCRPSMYSHTPTDLFLPSMGSNGTVNMDDSSIDSLKDVMASGAFIDDDYEGEIVFCPDCYKDVPNISLSSTLDHAYDNVDIWSNEIWSLQLFPVNQDKSTSVPFGPISYHKTFTYMDLVKGHVVTVKPNIYMDMRSSTGSMPDTIASPNYVWNLQPPVPVTIGMHRQQTPLPPYFDTPRKRAHTMYHCSFTGRPPGSNMYHCNFTGRPPGTNKPVGTYQPSKDFVIVYSSLFSYLCKQELSPFICHVCNITETESTTSLIPSRFPHSSQYMFYFIQFKQDTQAFTRISSNSRGVTSSIKERVICSRKLVTSYSDVINVTSLRVMDRPSRLVPNKRTTDRRPMFHVARV